MIPIAIDTETELVTARCKCPRLVCLSYAMPDGTKGLLDRGMAGKFFEAALRDPNVRIVGHNFAYDAAVLLREHPHLTSLVWAKYASDGITDTMLRQKLDDLAHGIMDHPMRPSPYRLGKSAYSLAALAKRHLGVMLEKGEDTWRTRYGELRDVPLSEWPSAAKEYPVLDATTTLDVYLRQKQAAKSLVSPDEFNQARHAWWLNLMSIWGMATDVPRAQKLTSKLEAELAEVSLTLVQNKLLRVEKKKGETVYVRDQKQSQAFMIEACAMKGVKPKLTDKGLKLKEDGAEGWEKMVALDVEACAMSGHPVLVAYSQYVHLQGLLSKNMPVMLAGEVHARFNSLLETGRTSSSNPAEGGGDNVQNPPRKGGVRECYCARPGTVFGDADYGGLELSTMAQACLWLTGRSTLAGLINAGKDPHLAMAANMLGLSYDEALHRHKLHGKWKAGDPSGVQDEEIDQARQMSKPCNFGFPGGMGPKTFVDFCAAQRVTMPLEKAYALRDVWRATYPEFPEAYFPRHAAMTANGMLASYEAFGSKRVRGGCDYTTLNNGYFQSLGADCAKDAGWTLSRACYDPSVGSVLFGSRPVNFIHDQFLVEFPEAKAAECAAELGRIMNEAGKKWMPDVPPVTVPCLARCWSKQAKDVYDERGKLIVWEEKKEAA